MLVDQHKLRRSLDRIGRGGGSLDNIRQAIDQSSLRRLQRGQRLPSISFPEALPISQHQQRLADMIRLHQVVIVCGETGSGKSTQLPKICLAAGYGLSGIVCQTQPRRIAARSVGQRVADELSTPLGTAVGYRVRFDEQISDQNYIRILTDGMLLAEFEQDRFLNRYDVIIIDEAHERSLNIDFLLGLLKGLLKKRPALRLIITSATLDSDKFSQHFDGAPSITVSGRTFPVEHRYRPIEAAVRNREGFGPAIHEATEELHAEAPGDVLVFLPGEREIRETMDWLSRRIKPGIELLPLYARLTPAEQQRIFRPGGSTRIILSTNVAETSLTVPGVRYVIDTGLARVSRYSPSRKIQRLPLEKISRAAADQRAGRCGRVAHGICIRLYDEDDYLARPRYTDPEIVRTSLADVILRMKSSRLGDIEEFPLIDRPARRQIHDGMQHLIELGALDGAGKLSATGRQISRMPVDPRIARMLLAAEKFDCLQEVIIIAAALSVPDPRQSPGDKVQHARQQHKALSAEESDFLVLLDIWRQFRRIQKTESKRQSYRWCEEYFLSVFRMREWGALQASLRLVLKQLKMRVNREAARPDAIHRALLTGLISNVAQLSAAAQKPHRSKSGKPRRGAEYHGTFGKTLQIFPGSVLHGSTPKWIMSAELVETAQLFARTVARADPKWLESAAGHLLQFHYSHPRWDRRQERVVANRRATLYGLTVYSGRKCDYSRIDPVDCRQIFIRSALVDGELDASIDFLQHNRALAAEIEALEHKTRRRDLLVDDAVIFDFYDRHIDSTVNSASSLRKWLRRLDQRQRDRLLIPRSLLLLDGTDQTMENYPDQVDNGGIKVELDYLFDPRSEHDGVTARIRLPLLNQMNGAVFDRLVPGMLQEKLVAMVRTLPKSLRRQFVPIPDTVERLVSSVTSSNRPIAEALAAALSSLGLGKVDAAQFDLSQLPPYLHPGFSLRDDNDIEIGFDRDLAQLQDRFGHRAHQSFVERGDATIERDGLTRWDFDELPVSIPVRIGDYVTEAYPALVDCEDSVSIEIFDHREIAEAAHLEGVRRLLWLTLPAHRKLSRKPLPEWQKISLMYAAIGDLGALQLSMFHKAQDQVFFSSGELPRTRPQFDHLLRQQAPGLAAELANIADSVARSLEQYRSIRRFIDDNRGELHGDTLFDVNEQLEWLVYDGFVDDIPADWLLHVPRYLEAIQVRLEQARLDAATDRLRQQKISPFWQRYLAADFDYSPALEHWRWMLEEYRVSVFAQGLKTSLRVSAKRLELAWQEVLSTVK